MGSLRWLPVNAVWARDAARWATGTPAIAAFSFLLLVQTAHLGEHVAQMVEIHLLGLTGAEARGIIGQLDIEWVHFLWNLGIAAALAGLLVRLGPNPWLVLATVFASWHLVEHDVIMRSFLATGIAGSPGLLASGGLIAGGLPLSRPDLHFVYNLVETIAIAIAYRASNLAALGPGPQRPA